MMSDFSCYLHPLICVYLSCAAQYKRTYHKEEEAPPLWPTKLVEWKQAPSLYNLKEGFAFCLFLQHCHPDLTKLYTFEKNMYRKKLHLEAITAAEEEMSRLVAEEEVKLASSTSEQNSADESEDMFGDRLDGEGDDEGHIGGGKRDRPQQSIDDEEDDIDEDDDEMEGGVGVQSKTKRQKVNKGGVHGRDDEDLQDQGDECNGDSDPPQVAQQDSCTNDGGYNSDDFFTRRKKKKKAVTGAGGGARNIRRSTGSRGKQTKAITGAGGEGKKKKSDGRYGIAGGVLKKKQVRERREKH